MAPPPDDKIVVTNPDPTVAVKEALELAIKNLDDKIDLRFRGIDQATILARADLGRQLSDLAGTINDKFIANEKLVDQLGKANDKALTAALVNASDLLKQIKIAFDESNKATNEKIDRLTSRLDMGEGRTGGASDNRQTSRQDVQESRQSADSTRNLIFALISVVLVATGIVVAVLLKK